MERIGAVPVGQETHGDGRGAADRTASRRRAERRARKKERDGSEKVPCALE